MCGEGVGVNFLRPSRNIGLGVMKPCVKWPGSIIFKASSESIFYAFILCVDVLMYRWMCECSGGCVSGDGLGVAKPCGEWLRRIIYVHG